MKNHIRIATRKSKLALWQANFVKSALEKKHPGLIVSLIEIMTEGDKQPTIPLAQMGGKSVFVKALQNALLNNEADIAVHSIKDMSVYPTDNLILAAVCERADPRDAFISNDFMAIESLPRHAIVGTSSPRRTCLIKSLRPDIKIELLRGNVDTRLAKLDARNYDAIILAAAGLHRLDLTSRIQSYFSCDFFTPAIGQGAIGVECREDDIVMRDLLLFLNHADTAHSIVAERRVNQIVGGDCHTVIGAHAHINQDQIYLSAMVGSMDGKIILRAKAHCDLHGAIRCGENVAKDLLNQGAAQLIISRE
ncbi:MAG: hydroxymethylbilane synthase [Gammaproteobacteria bacterium RIFCSPHIGHO2_12_FULL_38_11]|nr:MAG: hydroxymethylbilane synthase [Gammaproteobacteria bacterium RIFCSPHIGHO2_12_FULL_38_11]